MGIYQHPLYDRVLKAVGCGPADSLVLTEVPLAESLCEPLPTARWRLWLHMATCILLIDIHLPQGDGQTKPRYPHSRDGEMENQRGKVTFQGHTAREGSQAWPAEYKACCSSNPRGLQNVPVYLYFPFFLLGLLHTGKKMLPVA